MTADARKPSPGAPPTGASPAQEDLLAREAKYRALFEAESDAVFLIDNATGRILEANDAASTLYGYSRDEILRLKNTDLSAEPEDTHRVTTTTAISPGTIVRIPLRRHRRKDGTVFSVEITGRFFEWQGRSVHLAAIRDITARVQTEQALRASEERYRRLAEAVTDYIYSVRIEAGQVVETRHGPGCAAVTGYASEEFAADPYLWFRMVAPEDRPRVEDHARLLAAGEEVGPLEHRLVRKDGTWRWVRNTPVPHRDAQGHLVAYDGLVQDITEQRRAEEALAEHARQLEAVRGVSTEITQELDLGTVLRLVAERACQLTGAAAADIDLWHEERQLLVPEASYGHAAPRPTAARHLGEGAMGVVAQTGQGLIINDYRSSPVAYPATRAQTNITASLVEPLRYRGRLLGAIGVDHETAGRTFTQRDQATLRLFAAQAAIAIENARLHQEAVRQCRELEAVLQANRAIQSSLEVDQTLRVIIDQAMAISGASAVRLFLLEEETQLLRCRFGAGVSADESGIAIPMGEGFTGQVASTRSPLVVADCRTDARLRFSEHARRHGLISYLGLPVTFQDRLLGVLVINTPNPRTYTSTEIAFLSLFANQAAIAIQNARAHATSLRRGEELEALLRASRTVMAGLDLQTTLNQIVAEASRIAQCEHVKALLVDRGAQVLRVSVAQGDALPWFVSWPLGYGLSGRVAQTGRPLFAADSQDESVNPNARFDREKGLRTYLGLPIKRGEEVLGVLTFNTTAPKTYSPDEMAYLTAFADQAAIAIENARLYEAAQRELAERRQAEASLERRTMQLEAVRTVGMELTRELDLSRLLERVIQEAADLLGAVAGAVWLWNPAEEHLEPGAFIGHDPAWFASLRLRMGEGVTGAVAERRAGLIVEDVHNSRLCASVFRHRATPETVMAEPLLYQDRVVGTIALDRRASNPPFTAQDQEVLRLFAAQAAIAIENARLYTATQQALENLRRAQAEMVRTEQLRGLGQMAAGIAHDLNNTLAAVLGQAELLKLRVTQPEIRDGLALLETAAADGAAVVRRLQDFARPKGTSPLVPCDLAKVAREAVEIARPRWRDDPQRRGVNIAVSIALDDLPPILGNPPELREALTNLIFNAVDAMPQGGTLSLAGRPVSAAEARGSRGAEGQFVELTVHDTGVGMPPEVLAKAFEPFFTTKGVRGTGLGLAVVYGIMERHGGAIAASSAPMQGTTFTLTFQQAPEAPAVAVSPAESGPAVAAHRLLVVDDEPLVRQTLVMLLQTAGHTVLEAADGASALALLGQTEVDIVLTDLGMPGMSGWELAGAIKRLHPTLPILLLTGWQDQMPEDEANRQYVDGILGKPARLTELMRALGEVLDARSAR